MKRFKSPEWLDCLFSESFWLNCRSKSLALVKAEGNKLPGMGWPTNQPFSSKPILDLVQAHVCSLVYRFAICL
jgi:hypothetical protein